MIKPQRQIHRLIWLLGTPLLLLVLVFFSQPDTEISVDNAEMQAPLPSTNKGKLP